MYEVHPAFQSMGERWVVQGPERPQAEHGPLPSRAPTVSEAPPAPPASAAAVAL